MDEHDLFSIPVRVKTGRGAPPPRAGYPTVGDRYDGPIPLMVDVTPRRLQRFHVRPGEPIHWTFGPLEGTALADHTGAVTVPQLPLTTDWQTLVLQRGR